jgi:DNA-binding GntR family transcriptional regulator
MRFGLNQKNLGDQVVDYIKEYLLFSGKYKEEQKVSEHEIARALEISRSPVREAFRELQKEGLLVYKPRRGCFVARLSDDDVKELYKLRFWVESNLYDVIVQKNALTAEKYYELLGLTHETIAIIESDLNSFEKNKEYSRLGLKFHMYLCSLSGMKWPIKILSGLCNQMRMAMIRDINYAPNLRRNVDVHYEIMNCLRDKDVDRAKKLLAEDMKLYMKEIIVKS